MPEPFMLGPPNQESIAGLSMFYATSSYAQESHTTWFTLIRRSIQCCHARLDWNLVLPISSIWGSPPHDDWKMHGARARP